MDVRGLFMQKQQIHGVIQIALAQICTISIVGHSAGHLLEPLDIWGTHPRQQGNLVSTSAGPGVHVTVMTCVVLISHIETHIEGCAFPGGASWLEDVHDSCRRRARHGKIGASFAGPKLMV